jgi:hypothetical protein
MRLRAYFTRPYPFPACPDRAARERDGPQCLAVAVQPLDGTPTEWAEQVPVMTSKDKGNRRIWFYKSMQANRMKADFFEKLLAYFTR